MNGFDWLGDGFERQSSVGEKAVYYAGTDNDFEVWEKSQREQPERLE